MKNNKINYLVRISLLVAIELIFAFTPFGYIRTAGLEITFLMVPVVIAGICMGPMAGAILGGVFGITSFMTCFGTSAFGVALFTINPFYTFLVCVPTRIFAGWATGLVFKPFRKKTEKSSFSFALASLTGSLSNSVLFTGTLALLFYKTDFIQSVAQTFQAANPFTFIIFFVGAQGVIESVVVLLISTIICKALYKRLNFK